MSRVKLILDARTDEGCVRTNNEDNFVVCTNLESPDWTVINNEFALTSKGCLLVVADGMGGMNAGEVASAIAVDVVKTMFASVSDDVTKNDSTIRNYLIKVIQAADKEIVAYGKIHPEAAGMGTTVVIAWLINNMAYIAWCGDSRAYVYQSQRGLVQVSKDHSYVQELVDSGQISHEQAFYHPDNNIITKSLGNVDKKAIPDVVALPLSDGMRLLLCTDGLNGMLLDSRIQTIVSSESNIKICKDELINAAKEAGGHDNVTVVLCDVVSGAGEYKPTDTFSKDELLTQKCCKNKSLLWILYAIITIVLMGGSFFMGQKHYFELKTDVICTDSVSVDSLKDAIKSYRLGVKVKIDGKEYTLPENGMYEVFSDSTIVEELKIEKPDKKPQKGNLVTEMKKQFQEDTDTTKTIATKKLNEIEDKTKEP